MQVGNVMIFFFFLPTDKELNVNDSWERDNKPRLRMRSILSYLVKFSQPQNNICKSHIILFSRLYFHNNVDKCVFVYVCASSNNNNNQRKKFIFEWKEELEEDKKREMI